MPLDKKPTQGEANSSQLAHTCGATGHCRTESVCVRYKSVLLFANLSRSSSTAGLALSPSTPGDKLVWKAHCITHPQAEPCCPWVISFQFIRTGLYLYCQIINTNNSHFSLFPHFNMKSQKRNTMDTQTVLLRELSRCSLCPYRARQECWWLLMVKASEERGGCSHQDGCVRYLPRQTGKNMEKESQWKSHFIFS